MNLIFCMILGLTVLVAPEAFAATKAVKKNAPVVNKTIEKVNADLIKFNKENTRLTIAHLEMMRAKNIKNINFQFDAMVANQKEIQKASDSALAGGKVLTKENFETLSKELRKKHEDAQEKFMVTNKAEDEKFKALMSKRQEDFEKSKK